MIDNELHVIYQVIHHASIARSSVIDPDWFTDPGLKTLYKFVAEIDGNFEGEVDLKNKFELDHPTALKSQDWYEIDNHAKALGSFDTYVYWLQQDYLQAKSKDLAYRYSQSYGKQDKEALQQVLEDLDKPQNKNDSDSIDQLNDWLEDAFINDPDSGIKSFTGLQNILPNGIEGGQLIVVGARPGVGKSTFAINLMQTANRVNDGVMFDLYSLEMTNVENYKRLLSLESRIPLASFAHPKSISDKDKARAAANQIKNQSLFLTDDKFTLSDITQSIRRRANMAQMGKYVALVDYLQLVSVISHTDNRTLEIGKITRSFKQLANELNIPIILLSQLSRQLESRQDKKPILADLRDSGTIEQDANIVAFLYDGVVKDKHAEYQDAEDLNKRSVILDVQKNRNGAPGFIHFTFYPGILYFRED